MPKFKTKKRKGFHGKRPDEIAKLRREEDETRGDRHFENQPQPSTSSESGQSKISLEKLTNISEKKLLNTEFKLMESDDGVLTRSKSYELGLTTQTVEIAHGYKISEYTLLNECISKAAFCSSCKSHKSKLQLWQKNSERCGLAESMILKCSNCGEETPLLTSNKLPGRGGAFEVNRRSVLALESNGREKLARFCARMDLPPPVTKKAYNQHLKDIERASADKAEITMKGAATRLTKLVEQEDTDKIEQDDNGYTIANVAVSVDGTWQKRGHSSKIGVVFVISVLTGEVLDYKVLSHICHECATHDKDDKTSDSYKKWYNLHNNKCQINHTGSSGDMETQGAISIFSRSITARKLKYTSFIGDGDSSCFGRVEEAMRVKYGDGYIVVKEECVGHIQKRMGAALTAYKKGMKGTKLADGKTVGGAKRLTDDVIKRIQNYFGLAIRQNKGDLAGMKNAIFAIKHHVIENSAESLEKQHRFCPKTKGTWCKFWSDKIEGTSDYSSVIRLPEVFMQELTPIFKRLSEDGLLKRCLKGLTQNPNESVNGMLWSRISKTMFCGKRRVTIAACETVCVANTGAASKAMLMKDLGMSPGTNTMKAFRREDKMRIINRARKISEKYRLRRKQLRMSKKKNKDTSYKSGSFGPGVLPEVLGKKDTSKKRKRTVKDVVKPKASTATSQSADIAYVNEDEIPTVVVKNMKGKS